MEAEIKRRITLVDIYNNVLNKFYMKIHEYQARQLFRKYGIPVPEDVLCYTVSEVEKAARDLNRMVVVKAQP